jgi:hypothetical protein
MPLLNPELLISLISKGELGNVNWEDSQVSHANVSTFPFIS